MKLNEWISIKNSIFSEDNGLSSDPKDYYFSVFTNEEYSCKMDENKNFIQISRVCAIVCPKQFFDEEGYSFDGYVLENLRIPGFAEDQEGVISPEAGMPELNPEDMYELLLDVGLMWSEDFAHFTNDMDTTFFPGDF